METNKASEFLTEKPEGFLITGIGASAGGIQALLEFFQQVPEDSGIAYVVILHLSPDHDSQLAQVLQTVTTIPVTQVTEKTKIEPNHIYVVPPNQHLIMEDSFITPSVNLHVEERRAPVDIFFRTLADSHGPRAICVVLSGTGANGSMGLKRVKERGGVAYVQSPREAEFNEMPRNAIATDLIDEVLPVAEIPARIMAYRDSLGTVEIAVEAEKRPQQQQQALREIFTQLRIRTGHDFSNYKRPTLLRRIERRINIRHLPDLPSYATFLHENVEEANALLKDLLISVTNFFRDKKSFEAIEQEVLPVIFKSKTAHEEVRIWVAGCATGEEAYSLAMLVAEKNSGLLDPPKVQIFATDIDEAALTVAREGLYTLNDAADVSPDRLRNFFYKEGDNYRVKREIREMILFANHNFLKDPPFSRLDLVSCRNVLIYLNATAQERVMEAFHFALKPGGYLFLGSSESVDGASDLFAILNREHHIYRTREIATRHYPVPESVPNFSSKAQPFVKVNDAETHSSNRLSFGELHQKLLEQYAPPSLVINEDYEILHMSEKVGSFLEFSGGEPTKNLLKLIKPELRLELRSALFQATQRQVPIEARNLPFSKNGERQGINIQVRPVTKEGDMGKGFILIIFEAHQPAPNNENIVITADEPIARHLEEELIQVKAQLRYSTEQYEYQAEELKASNEELQAMNEELRSAAEELETSKEELQSINEELRTVNQELKVKIEETTVTSNNLQNLINSADVATVFLDRAFCIQLYTPAALQIFNLIPSDYGRPISDITHRLEYNNLLQDAEVVLDKLTIVEREVTTTDQRTFMVRVLPYRTAEDRINGVVVTFFDITERKRAEEILRQAEEQYRVQLETQVQERTAELRDSKELLQATMNSSLEMIQVFKAVRDERGEIIDFIWLLNNHAAEEVYGNVIGKGLLALNPGVVEEGIFDTFKKVVQTGIPDTSERHYVHEQFDGWFQQSVVKLNDGIASTTTNITERKKAEQQLQQSKELLQATIDSTLDIIQVFSAVRNEDGKIIDFTWLMNNTKGTEQNGDVLGESILSKSPGVMASGVFHNMVKVVETGAPIEHEQYYNYEEFDGWFYQALVKSGDGLVMTTRDITQQKKSADEILRLKEEVAQRATDKYEKLFNSIGEGFCIIELLYDENGKAVDYRWLEANPNYEKHSGIKSPAGKLGSEIIPSTENYWLENYDKVLKTGKASRFENWHEATGHWYQTYASRIGDNNSRQIAIVFDDITERKQQEQHQQFLLEFSDALRAETDADAVVNQALQMLAQHLQLDRCHVGVYRLADDWCEFPYQVGNERVPPMPKEGLPLSGFPEALQIASNETLVISDFQNAGGLTVTDKRNFKALNFGAAVIATVRKGEKYPLWSIAAVSATPRRWTDFEIRLLEEATERTWTAVERAKVEEAFRKSEKRLHSIANLVPDLLWDSEPDGSTNWYNQRWLEYTGQLFEQAIGWGWTEAIHPEDLENSAKRYGEAVAAGKPLQQEYRIRRYDGAYRWFVVSTIPVKDEHGKVIKIYGAATDIHDRKQVEEALRESELKYRSIFENIDEGFTIQELITDKNGNVTDLIYREVNEAYTQHSGISNALNRKASELFPQLEQHWLDSMTHVYKTGESVRTEGYQADLHRWFTLQYSQIGGPSSKLISVVFNDITERKQREQRQEFILKLGDALRPLSDSVEIQRAASRIIGEYLQADRAYYVDIKADNEHYNITDNYVREGVPPLIIEGGLLDDFGWTREQLAAGRMVRIADSETDPNLSESARAGFRGVNARAALALPLIKDGRWAASFVMHHLRPHEWTDEEVKLAEETAERTWAAVERAKAEQALLRSEEQHTFLLQFADALRAEPNAEAITNRALHMLFEHLQIDRCYVGVYRLAEDRGDFTHQVGNDRVPPVPDYVRLSDFPDALQHAFEKTLVIDDVATAEGFSDTDRQNLNALHMQALVAASLRNGGHKPIWSIVAISASPRHWTPREVALIEEVTERTWVALERCKAEAALRESEARLRAMIENLPGGAAFILDSELRYQLAGGEALRLTGFTEEDFVGKTVWEALPEQASRYAPNYRRTLGGEPFSLEHQEHGRTFISRGIPLRNAAGEVYAALAVSYDITERKRAEEALRESQERLQTAISIQTVGVIFFDLDGNIHEANEAFLRMSGYPAEALVSGNIQWDKLTAHEFREVTEKSRAELLAQGENTPYEKQYIRPDGSRWWGLFAGKRLSENEYVEFVLDITDRKNTEEKLKQFNELLEQQVTERTQDLRQSRDMLQSVFDTTLLSLSILKAVRDESGALIDFRIALVNKELERATGRTDLVGRLYTEEYPGIKQAGLFELMCRVVETGEPGQVEYFYPHEGFNKWYSAMFVKMDDGLVASNLDITERKQAEAELSRNFTILKQAEEVAGMGSWEFDYTTNSFHWSEGMYHLFGLPVGSPKTLETYLNYAIAEDQAIAEKLVHSIKYKPQPLEETLRIRVHGQVITIKVKAIVVYDDLNRPYKMLGVDLDISEIKRLEQENLQIRLDQQKALLLAILDAQQEERRRISESLHNGVGQLLYATKLNLDKLATQIPDNILSPTAKLLSEAI